MKDKAEAVDEKYAITIRTGGALQAVGGAATAVAGYGGATLACTTGVGCIPAAMGGTALATYGLDNLYAGTNTLIDGKNHRTWGADAISQVFGISAESAELLYSLPSMGGGIKPTISLLSSTRRHLSDFIQGVDNISPYSIRFSQQSVSFSKIDRSTNQYYTYDDLKSSMSSFGWKGMYIDVVRMPDGKLTSMDNTRLASARETLTSVRVKIHEYNEAIPQKILQDRGWRSNYWGDAIIERINNQSKSFKIENPQGSDFMPRLNKGGTNVLF